MGSKDKKSKKKDRKRKAEAVGGEAAEGPQDGEKVITENCLNKLLVNEALCNRTVRLGRPISINAGCLISGANPAEICHHGQTQPAETAGLARAGRETAPIF